MKSHVVEFVVIKTNVCFGKYAVRTLVLKHNS